MQCLHDDSRRCRVLLQEPLKRQLLVNAINPGCGIRAERSEEVDGVPLGYRWRWARFVWVKQPLRVSHAVPRVQDAQKALLQFGTVRALRPCLVETGTPDLSLAGPVAQVHPESQRQCGHEVVARVFLGSPASAYLMVLRLTRFKSVCLPRLFVLMMGFCTGDVLSSSHPSPQVSRMTRS